MSDNYYIYPTKFKNLFPKSQIENWKSQKNVHTYKKGEFICTPGQFTDSGYLIIEGNAQIFYINLTGKECVLGILSIGDFIDLLQIFSNKESKLFAKALTEVKVISITKHEVKKAIDENKELSMLFLSYISNSLQETIEILEQVAYGKVEERLLFLLDKLASKSGDDQEWYALPEFLTHHTLAGMIGSTRETVTFLINKLIQTKKVKQENHCIWIKNDKNMKHM